MSKRHFSTTPFFKTSKKEHNLKIRKIIMAYKNYATDKNSHFKWVENTNINK